MPRILEFPCLPSTNSYVKAHYAELSHGDVILAARQTEGRGRKDRTWLSAKGGLYFSLVLKPPRSEHLHTLTQLLCLAICRAAEPLGIAAAIKWPNDVLVGDRKLSGVLAETVLAGGEVAALALGAGVNVAQADLQVPGKSVTTLRKEGCETSPRDFLSRLLPFFFDNYPEIVEKGFAPLHAEYLARATGLGRTVHLETGGAMLAGTLNTFSERGNLVITLDTGETREVLTGEIL